MKEDLEDIKRYKQHIKTIDRALEIIESDESPIVKNIQLTDIGCDRNTYGEWHETPNGLRLSPIRDKKIHCWSLQKEKEGFIHAIKYLYFKKQQINPYTHE